MRTWRLIVPLAVGAVVVGGCSGESIVQDASIACGWDEPEEPLVLPTEATTEQLAINVQRANRRLAAAERVVQADERFTALADALAQTASLATRIQDMSPEEIATIPESEWDMAKYAQFVARDQCEQLEMVVADER